MVKRDRFFSMQPLPLGEMLEAKSAAYHKAYERLSRAKGLVGYWRSWDFLRICCWDWSEWLDFWKKGDRIWLFSFQTTERSERALLLAMVHGSNMFKCHMTCQFVARISPASWFSPRFVWRWSWGEPSKTVSARERLRLWQRRHRTVCKYVFNMFPDVFSEASTVSQLGDSRAHFSRPSAWRS